MLPPPPREPYIPQGSMPSQSSTELVPTELSELRGTVQTVELNRISLQDSRPTTLQSRSQSMSSIDSSGTSIQIEGVRQLRETCLSFVGSLPRSCLSFLALAVLASLANCVHGATLIAEGASCLAESDLTATQHRQINDNFIFYGTSQAPPPVHALHALR